MKKSSIKIISLLVVVTLAMTSCLNDLEDFMGQFSGSPAIAELSEAANAATGTVSREIINPLVSKEFTLRVNIAAVNAVSAATTVTLAIDNTLIDAYNTAKGLTGAAAAIPVPLAALTIASYDVVIPAGKREFDWTFTINPTLVPNVVDKFYILPIKIASVNNGVVISGNYNSKLIRVLSRNQWDGMYTVTGTMTDAASASLSGYYPHDIELITSSGTVCSVYDETIGGYYYPILSGGSLSYYGSFGLNITFDKTTNTVTAMSNYWGVVSNTRAAAIDPSGANSVNSTTKDITLKYFMLQPSVITAAPNIRCRMNEVWKYNGPRPE
jgi:hypothetical protein